MLKFNLFIVMNIRCVYVLRILVFFIVCLCTTDFWLDSNRNSMNILRLVLVQSILNKQFRGLYILIRRKNEPIIMHWNEKRRDHIKDSFTALRDAVPSLQGEKVVSVLLWSQWTEINRSHWCRWIRRVELKFWRKLPNISRSWNGKTKVIKMVMMIWNGKTVNWTNKVSSILFFLF